MRLLIVVWVCLHLPISVVYTLRETSIVFTVLLATLILKEKLTVSKIFLIGMLCVGVGLIKADLYHFIQMLNFKSNNK